MELFFGKKTLVMGIVNVTPDSFFDGGKYSNAARAYDHAMNLLDEGADIVDIGGESTRPGACTVSVQEEIDRVIPVVEKIHTSNPDAFISVDTMKSEVALAACGLGARMVNDVSGLNADNRIAEVCAGNDAYLVLMHMRGTPETMQSDIVYQDLIGEISSALSGSAAKALSAGVQSNRIILDPGIGFSKSIEQNYMIIDRLEEFRTLGYPLLMGLSRKSLVGKLLAEGEDRLPATVALNAVSVLHGADIIRVHDVKEHVLAMKAVDMLKRMSG
jgi:dihydropteroate synthase